MSRYYEIIDNDLHVGYVSEEYVMKKFDERILTGKAECNFLIGEDEAIDVEPVKHGHWVEENTRTHSMQFKCSVCGRIAYYPQNHHSTESKRCGYAYCPNCGSRMDGRKDDE